MGYVIGIDLCLNGEFVFGVEFWINFFFLWVCESFNGVQYFICEVGQIEGQLVDDVFCFIDQFMNLLMFFQDYLFNSENFCMYFNLIVGIGLFFGLQGNNEVFCNIYCFLFYYWVDIGFSLQLFDEERCWKNFSYFFSFICNIWLSLEVFNFMQV